MSNRCIIRTCGELQNPINDELLGAVTSLSMTGTNREAQVRTSLPIPRAHTPQTQEGEQQLAPIPKSYTGKNLVRRWLGGGVDRDSYDFRNEFSNEKNKN